MIVASALAGFWTLPPNEPECRSRSEPADIDLGVHEAAQADRDGRPVALEEAGVADDRQVGRRGDRGSPTSHGSKLVGAGLLLALEDDLDVDRQPAARLEPAPERPTGGGGRWPLSSAAPRA